MKLTAEEKEEQKAARAKKREEIAARMDAHHDKCCFVRECILDDPDIGPDLENAEAIKHYDFGTGYAPLDPERISGAWERVDADTRRVVIQAPEFEIVIVATRKKTGQ